MKMKDQADIGNWICGIIQSYGVLNVQRLCRIMNNKEFKFCHSKHEKYKHIDNRMDSQFIKQCNDCNYHYRDVHNFVMKLIKNNRIKTKKMIFYDVKNDNQDKRMKNDRGRKRDLFRFIYLDQNKFDDLIGKQTLDYYIGKYENEGSSG